MKPLITLLGCALLTASAIGQTDMLGSLTSNINIEGLETQFDPVTGIATATGDVHIVYEDVEIKAGRADYNSNTGDIIAKQDVTVVKAGEIFRGENIIYNVKTEELSANHIRSSLSPMFYDADDFETNAGELTRIDGGETYFTTHDAASPNYHIKAKSITIYPGDRVVMKNIKYYVGKTPILWLPYLVQPLDDEIGYFFQPGYSSQWGAFLLNQYGVMYGDHTLAKYNLDLRSERGVAGGVDFFSEKWRDNPHIGHLKLYYGYDLEPYQGLFDSVRSPELLDENRYRIAFQHRIFIPGPEKSTWYVDFDITALSDVFMLEDFFLDEYRVDPQPDNIISLVKRSDSFTASLLARFQLNDFYTTDERLPELAFDFTRSQIFNTPIFYQGETSLGLYREKLSSITKDSLKAEFAAQRALAGLYNNPGADSTLSENDLRLGRDAVEAELTRLTGELNESEYFRFHTYNEFLYPVNFGSGDWISFVPRIGAGATYYDDIQGDLYDGGSDTKPIFHAGFDFAMKFSKVWDDVQNRTLGLDGLRHVVQPYVNYSYVNADEIEGLPGIDRLTPSTRPRPIDIPQFTATDDLRSWNIARLGVRNLLQTKRATGNEQNANFNYAGINTYVDVFMEDPEYDRSISNLYNDLFWHPLPWLMFNLETQLPIGDSEYNFTEVNTSITWLPTDYLSWTFGHKFLSDNPLFENSSLLTSSFYARLSENWGFSMNHIYELDDSTLEYQSYSIHRDLASWRMGLGGLVRDNRVETEFGLLVTFTLKAFPTVSVPFDLDPNPTGRGGSE